jgi:recombination protein RecR
VKSVERLIAALKRLPGVGPKQAERLTMYILRAPHAEVEGLAEALRESRASVRTCGRCGDFTDRDLCRLCSDPARDQSSICVIEEPQDLAALER